MRRPEGGAGAASAAPAGGKAVKHRLNPGGRRVVRRDNLRILQLNSPSGWHFWDHELSSQWADPARETKTKRLLKGAGYWFALRGSGSVRCVGR
ncbi:hypothetical protein PHYC_02478 [Phycisphaerales bacterium]|nr:hypothetical protein PHYC_02478 [Phycisphaerales bacterium]